MEEDKKSFFTRVYIKIQQSFFDIMLDLLKEKTCGIPNNFISKQVKSQHAQ